MGLIKQDSNKSGINMVGMSMWVWDPTAAKLF